MAISEPDWPALYPEDPFLAVRASEIWTQTVAAMQEAGTWSLTNALAVKRYAVTCVTFDVAAAKVADQGAVIEDGYRGTSRWNPWWTAFKDCDVLCSAAEDRLGLSPKSRGKVSPVKAKAATTKAATVYLVPRT